MTTKTTTNYTWACLACAQTNPPGTARCERCGCPAEATALQIETTRRNWHQRQGRPLALPVDPIAVLKSLPLLWIAAVLLLVGGAVFLIVDAGPSASAFGGLLIALAALAASSNRPGAVRPS